MSLQSVHLALAVFCALACIGSAFEAVRAARRDDDWSDGDSGRWQFISSVNAIGFAANAFIATVAI